MSRMQRVEMSEERSDCDVNRMDGGSNKTVYGNAVLCSEEEGVNCRGDGLEIKIYQKIGSAAAPKHVSKCKHVN